MSFAQIFALFICNIQSAWMNKSAEHVLCSFIPWPDQVRPTKLALQLQKYRLSFKFSVLFAEYNLLLIKNFDEWVITEIYYMVCIEISF